MQGKQTGLIKHSVELLAGVVLMPLCEPMRWMALWIEEEREDRASRTLGFASQRSRSI